MVKLHELQDPEGKNIYTPAEVVSVWRSIQQKGASHYLEIFLKGFSRTHFISDPHLENIMAVFQRAQKDQIELKMLDVGAIRSIVRQGEIDTRAVDVGNIGSANAVMVCDFFDQVYEYLYVRGDKYVLKNLPQLALPPLPTRMEFLLNLIQGLDEADKSFVLALLLQGMPEKINSLNPRLIRFYETEPNAEEMLELIRETNAQDRQFHQELETYLFNEADKQILSRWNATERIEPKKLAEEWRFILNVCCKENSPRLFDDVNGMLELLDEEAASVEIRSLSRRLLNKRLGITPPDFDLNREKPAPVETAL